MSQYADLEAMGESPGGLITSPIICIGEHWRQINLYDPSWRNDLNSLCLPPFEYALDDSITSVRVQAHNVRSGLHYHYDKPGSWASESEACQSNNRSIPLRKITYDLMGESTKTWFEYDEYDRVIRQNPGVGAGCIIYGYATSQDGSGLLNRIWAGVDPNNDYCTKR